MKNARILPVVRRGVVLTEACVSLTLVGLVLSMASILLTSYARSTDYFVNYRRAQLAAESCVERIRAGALELAEASFTDEEGVTCDVHITPVPASWEPLQGIRVTASFVGRHGRRAAYTIHTYVAPQSRPEREGP